MKDDLVRFSISVDWDLLKEFDDVIQKKGYENRSFAIRSILREFIYSEKSSNLDARGTFVVITLSSSEENICCSESVHIALPIDTADDKRLNLCIFTAEYSKVKEMVKKIESNPAIEFYKLIPVNFEER